MNSQAVREYQQLQLRAFVEAQTYSGVTLDYGCGLAPYRDVVERDGEWVGYNRKRFLDFEGTADIGPEEPITFNGYDTVLCTQVLQYVPDVPSLLADFHWACRGKLVLTYATNWPEVQLEDLWRFTRTGMEKLLDAQWVVTAHEMLGGCPFGTSEFMAFGYGLVAVPR